MGSFIAEQIYDGRYFDLATRAARSSIDSLTANANGRVTLRLYKGNLLFESMTELTASLYNEADSSMEASDGFDPASSQGYAEIISVEALALAKAGHFESEA